MLQQRCVVFAGRRGLDQAGLRQSVARIPEVSRKLKLAQILIDKVQEAKGHIDLFSALNASEGEFASKQSLRALMAAIVQLGLYERYARFYGQATFLVGNTNGVSAISTISGTHSFEEMVENSSFYKELIESKDLPEQQQMMGQALTLTGLSLEEFGVYSNQEGNFEKQDWGTQDSYQIMSQLYQDHQVEQFVHVGPHHEFRVQEMSKRKIYEFSLWNSVELDPILNSFWKTVTSVG